MGDSISRAEAVSLLWKLKQASDSKSSSDIPYVHFNMLLTDPRYREQILTTAADSRYQDLQQIANQLRGVKMEGRLIRDPAAVRVNRAGKRETEVTFLSSTDVPDQRIVKAGIPWLSMTVAALLLMVVFASIVGAFYYQELSRLLGSEVLISEDILQDTRWEAGKTYILDRVIYVESGADLTIDAGVTVQGKPGSALVITRGSRLFARGTRARPIVMTSAREPGSRAPGDWGGLVLLGSAPVNNSNLHIEGLDPTDPRGLYGGVTEMDSCGVLEFVRVEYAGFEVYAGNELNGLTLGGCGSQTEISHVQVHLPLDDGIEVFGGTVDLKHILVTGPGDDGLDWDLGWQGRAQFVIIQQHRDRGDNGFEGDSNSERPGALPASRPVIFNATLIGGFSDSKSQRGMLLRHGTGGHFANILLTGFSTESIDIRNRETVKNLAGNRLRFESILMFDIGANGRQFFAPEDGKADDDGGFAEASLFENREDIRLDVNPGFGFSVRDSMNPEFSPQGNKVVDLFGTSPPQDDFWDQDATYIGALPSSAKTNWLNGWTSYAPD
ncbi:MAG: hypothetical protein R3208_01385 [Ketobacteraceae bacterium]|nr:hypothetical protein [Ketobacteraceae bacterium]